MPAEANVPTISKAEAQNLLPDPTGDNKYTKAMVPGYTGIEIFTGLHKGLHLEKINFFNEFSHQINGVFR